VDLLQAFTDDSAAQAGDKRLFLAGYRHRADVWASFSKAWHEELKAWPAIEYLKASEAHHLNGQFIIASGMKKCATPSLPSWRRSSLTISLSHTSSP
jgi:hypothetical protein